MSRAAWAAIIAAIAFPTIALVVVLLARPGPPPGPPGPPPPHPRAQHGPPPGAMPPEMLIKLRKPLELTDEQVDRIWDIVEPMRRRMLEVHSGIEDREGQLATLLEAEDPDVKAVEALVDELTGLHAERAKLEVLTPLRVRKVLTDAQRAKLMEIWKQQPPAADLQKKREPLQPGPGKQPPRKQPPAGPPPGKHPPLPPFHQKAPPPPPPGADTQPPAPPKVPDFQ
jgi:Spy/CpxP family protein refolding chaperone